MEKAMRKQENTGKKHLKWYWKALIGVVAALLILGSFAGYVASWTNLFNLSKTGKSGNVDIDKIFSEIPMADTVYAVERDGINAYGGGAHSSAMLESVQGIVSQTAAQLVVLGGGLTQSYVTSYAAAHPEITFKLFKFTAAGDASALAAQLNNAEIIDITSVWDIVDKFRSHYADNGFTTFLHDDVSPDINMAATIAGVERWLCVPTTLKEAAIAHGYVEKKNTADYKGDSVKRQKAVFNEYKKRLNKNFVVHMREDYNLGRDIAIAKKAVSFFTKDFYSTGFMQFGGGFKLNTGKMGDFIAERNFRHKVLRWANPSAPIIGFWGDTKNDTDEMVFIQDISIKGNWIVPYHNDDNVLFMHAMDKNKVTRPAASAAKAVAEEGKHYVALYITDGDNISWIYKNGSEGSLYNERIQSSDTFKLSVSYPPMFAALSPFAAEMQFRTAEAANGGNNYFFSGVSGAGVAYPAHMPKKNLADLAAVTGQAMQRSDMNVAGLMEFIRLDKKWKSNTQRAVNAFAKQENIKGGIYQIDGEQYVGGEGMFFWSDNGKPFITSKYSLWPPSGGVTDAWLTEFAAKINGGRNDYKSEDGYTVVCIQPWGIKYTDIQKLVAQLSANIELVTVEDLIDLAAANIKRK